MLKATLTLIVTLFLGVLAEGTIGTSWNMPGIGAIVATAVMGAFIIYFNDKKK